MNSINNAYGLINDNDNYDFQELEVEIKSFNISCRSLMEFFSFQFQKQTKTIKKTLISIDNPIGVRFMQVSGLSKEFSQQNCSKQFFSKRKLCMFLQGLFTVFFNLIWF